MNARRALLAAALCLAAAGTAGSDSALSERERAEDFDALWQAIDAEYAYFGTQRLEWRRTRDRWRPRALRAATQADLARALEAAIAELRDDHVELSGVPGLPRRVPFDTDIWAAWRDDAAVIEAVRTFSEADVAGLRPGQVVRSIAGIPVQAAVSELLGAVGANTPGARDWTLRRALAGPREGTLAVEIAEARGPRAYAVARSTPKPAAAPPLIARRVGERRDLGYIRLKAPLSDPAIAAQFEGALGHITGTRALILDLRETPGPLQPARAHAGLLAILSHFIEQTVAWQVRESRAGERVVDLAQPAATRFAGRVAVLVDRWTAGESEALAVAMQSAAGARLVGTRMAGLRGELRELRLPRSGIVLRFPAEKTLRPDGKPRESVVPDLLVDLAAPQGGPGDPILYQALKLLEK